MKAVMVYLIFVLGALLTGALLDLRSDWLGSTPDVQLTFRCAIAGGFGGVIYCLRGVYLNASVRKSWDPEWIPWYVLRPFVSFLVGGVSYLFIRAGLIVLESAPRADSSKVGFFALAVIAGLNVDRFLEKLEDLARVTWGIRPSRTAEASTTGGKD